MAAGILVVVGYRAAALVHLIMLAAMVMMTLRNPVLHNRTMLMHAAMINLGGAYADVQTGGLGLAVQGEKRYASDYGEFGNVFLHGLCFGFLQRLHASYIYLARRSRIFI